MYCNFCMRKIEETDKECPFCGASIEYEAPVHHLKPGTVLKDRYLVGAAIGEGGFGITYIGLDNTLKMRIAVKEYYPNGFVNRNNTVSTTISESKAGDRKEFFDQGKEKFLKEAQILANFCGKPGIVEVRDFFEENNTAYIVMEYLDGQTLKEYLKENKFMRPQKIYDLMLPLMGSLKDIHAQGIIHRDISPDNIMLVDGTAKLLDFGSARMFSDQNRSLSIMVKFGYAPLEQYGRKGKQGPWTDIYALCATMYKCITDITPDDPSDRQVSDQTKTPSALGIEIDRDFENALMKGMAIQYTDRFQSIDELLDGFAGKIRKSADDKRETVLIPKTETKNDSDSDNDKKTEWLFKPDNKSIVSSTEPTSEPTVEAAPISNKPEPMLSPESPKPIISAKKSDAKKTEYLFKPDTTPAADLPVPENNKDDGSEKTTFLRSAQTDESAAVVQSADSETTKRQKLKYIIGLAASAGVLCVALILAVVLPKIGSRQSADMAGEAVSSSFEESADSEPVSSSTASANGVNAPVISSTTTSSSSSSSPVSSSTTTTSSSSVPVSSSTTTTTSSSSKPVSSSTTTTTSSSSKPVSSSTTSTSPTPTVVPVEPAEIVTILGKEYDVSTTTRFEYEGSNINNDLLKQVCKLKNLEILSLGNYNENNNITDLSEIENLKKLKSLTLINTLVQDISPLSKLTNLTELDLAHMPISNITPLASLTNLNELALSENQVSDITSLSKLTNLTKLAISFNPLSDISPLANLTNLTQLYLRDLPISNITPLRNLTNLTDLGFRNNKISNLTSIANLTKLTYLEINGNQVGDITPLNTLTNLTVLWLDDNSISDITPLSKLTKLTKLGLWTNQVENLKPLTNLINLEYLYLDSNRISDVTPLSNLTNLTILYLGDNNISNVTPLSKLTNLKDLVLHGNPISESDIDLLDKNLPNCDVRAYWW